MIETYLKNYTHYAFIMSVHQIFFMSLFHSRIYRIPYHQCCSYSIKANNTKIFFCSIYSIWQRIGGFYKLKLAIHSVLVYIEIIIMNTFFTIEITFMRQITKSNCSKGLFISESIFMFDHRHMFGSFYVQIFSSMVIGLQLSVS